MLHPSNRRELINDILQNYAFAIDPFTNNVRYEYRNKETQICVGICKERSLTPPTIDDIGVACQLANAYEKALLEYEKENDMKTTINENTTCEVIDFLKDIVGATVLGIHTFEAPWEQLDDQAEINVTIPVRTFYDKVIEPYYYNEIKKCINTPITMHGQEPGRLTGTPRHSGRYPWGSEKNYSCIRIGQKSHTGSYGIKKIETYNNRVVIVRFIDGTYTKSVCAKDDIFDIDTGITICLFKKHLGANGNKEFNDLIRKAHKIIDIQEKEAKKEDKIKAKNKQKLEKLKKKREAKKLKEREERIDIIAEGIRKGSVTE